MHALSSRDDLEFLESLGQDHLIAHLMGLDKARRETLAARIKQLPWGDMRATWTGAHHHPRSISAAPVVDRSTIDHVGLKYGEAMYAAGEIAVLTTVGGNGTRAGMPKGEIRIDPDHSLYHIQALKMHELHRRFPQHLAHWILLTSPSTHHRIVATFNATHFYGLPQRYVNFVMQDTMPAMDEHNRLLLRNEHELLENPNGHGGGYKALTNPIVLRLLLNVLQVKYLLWTQVDNALIPFYDPGIAYLADAHSSQMVTKLVAVEDAHENVGMYVQKGARCGIVEYTEVTEKRREREPEVFKWGSIASHMMNIQWLAELEGNGIRLPLHRSAPKQIEAWDPSTRQLTRIPARNFEHFIFDLLEEADKPLGLVVARENEFNPVKRMEGDRETPATAMAQLQQVNPEWWQARTPL